MKSSILLLFLILQCIYVSVLSSALRDRRIKGDKRDNNRNMQALVERKNVPPNHAAKTTLKLARSAVFVADTPATPTASPTASRKVRDPTPSPTASTKAPTKNPTKFPTPSPTIKAPTRQPTPQPTREPTPQPTKPPTRQPTPQPTREPTPQPTKPPTRQPTPQLTSSSQGSFQLRLYWDSTYFWQETNREVWWCMECTKCNEYSLGDGPNHGCVVTGNTGSSCQPGNLIWIRKCKDSSRDYKFNIIKNQGSGDQVRVQGSTMCLSTVQNRYLELQPCDNTKSIQLWKPIANLNKFELRPYYQRNWSSNDAVCLTQMHHPKDKELVGLQPCRRALGHETLYWEEYHR
jgi:hypothetical protein